MPKGEIAGIVVGAAVVMVVLVLAVLFVYKRKKRYTVTMNVC